MIDQAFQEYLSKVAEEFKNIPQDEPVKLVSNLDADGISACAVMSRALKRLNKKHTIRIIHQLREKELVELNSEPYDYYIFTDLGSGALDLIDSVLDYKKVLVLDHHHPKGEAEDVWHVNPHMFGIDGSGEISASGVTFLFCRELDRENEDMAHIALIGAIGDVQEDDGFIGLNNFILDIAQEKGVVKVEKELNLYGIESRPIHKLLEYSSDLHIPGVSNSESGTIQFLMSLGIEPKIGSKWKHLGDLNEDEKKRLVAGIIMKRLDEDNPEDIFSNSYIFPDGEGVFRNAKEFSTLLNACGRMDNASIGVGACLGDPKYRKQALKVIGSYKGEIVEAMRWYEANQDSDRITKGDGYIIINAKNDVLNTIIGTMISILSKSGNLEPDTILLSMARKPGKITKVSIRVCENPEGIHLKDIVSEIADSVDGQSGGHQYAAGAIIPTEKEEEFIEKAISVFEKLKTRI